MWMLSDILCVCAKCHIDASKTLNDICPSVPCCFLKGPPERQYALILVTGGDTAFNCWNTVEDQVNDLKDPEEVWDTSE